MGLMVVSPAIAADGMAFYKAFQAAEKKHEASAKTMTVRQTIEAQGMTAEVTLSKKGEKMRMESVVKASPSPMMGKVGDKTIVIDDGIQSWTFSPMMGVMKLAHEDEDDEDDRMPVQVTDLGRETVSGLACRKLDVDYGDGEIERLWISEKDRVLVKEESGMDDDRTTVIYEDFKTVNGRPFAHRITTYEAGERLDTVRIASVVFNASVDDALFDPNRVKGYARNDAAGGKGQGGKGKQQATDPMMMMQMSLEIQQLYQSGQVEKAKALEKKMQSMMGQ
jgi:outer membrane lipoprotein-sorting protein